MSRLSGRRLVVYLFLCAVWGSTWLAIKVGLRDLPPLRFAGFRMALACVLLAPFAFRRGRTRPTRREALLVGWSGFLQIGLAYALLFLAIQRIDSALAALLFASFPIWVGAFGHWLLPDEPMTARTVSAGMLGLAGVAAIEAPELGRVFSSGEVGAIAKGGALVLLSAIVSAYANIVNKRSLARISPPTNVWGQTLVGALLLLLLAILLERGVPSRWSASAIGTLVYLALFGTAVAFGLLFWLIPRVPVAVVGSIPLVDTLLAVLLGSAVLGERFSVWTVAGGILILAGVLLSTQEPSGESLRAG